MSRQQIERHQYQQLRKLAQDTKHGIPVAKEYKGASKLHSGLMERLNFAPANALLTLSIGEDNFYVSLWDALMKTFDPGEVWESKLQERMIFIQEFMRAHGPWPSGTMLSYVGEATFGDTCFWSYCRWHVAPAGDWFELLVHEYFCGLRRGTNNCDAVFGSCKYVSLNAFRWKGIREKVIHGWLAAICVRINQGNFQVNRDINHFTQTSG